MRSGNASWPATRHSVWPALAKRSLRRENITPETRECTSVCFVFASFQGSMISATASPALIRSPRSFEVDDHPGMWGFDRVDARQGRGGGQEVG